MTLAELAENAGVPARTVRFYIARGLVPGPATAGRAASYGREHLERLRQIRKLQARGMMLAEIARALDGRKRTSSVPEPSAWWQFPVAADVMVWVRADAAPWRARKVREALEEMTARLQAGEEDRT
jgi:DNA-binding transcriptional MerR regulator